MTSFNELWKHSVQQFELSRYLENMITVELTHWSMTIEEVRMVTNFSKLHNSILQRSCSLIDFGWVNHQLVTFLNTFVNKFLLS